MMIKYESKKLFYDKYIYKLGVHNPVAFIFRNKNLSHARKVIDELNSNVDNQKTLQYKTCADALRHIDITVDELHDLKYLLTQFKENTEFMVRCEGRKMGVFSNNDNWLKQLSKKLNCVCDFYEPADDLIDVLLNNKNILVKNPPFAYEYKITLGDKVIDSNFYNWAKLNPNKVRVSPGLLKTIYDKGYVKGKYLYLRDAKILTLAHLFLSGNISRIDTIVLKGDVDK